MEDDVSNNTESDLPPLGAASDRKVNEYIEKLRRKEHSRKGRRPSTESPKESAKVHRYIQCINSTEEATGTTSARVLESSILNTRNIQRRYVLITVSTCASFLTMALRGTINVPLVSTLGQGVVFKRPTRTESECAYVLQNLTKAESKVYEYGEHWDEDTIAVVLSTVYIGFLVTPTIGGYISYHYSPKNLISMSLYISGILCMVLPLAASTQTMWAVSLIRVVQGAVLGLILPAIMTLFSRWLPKEEVSFLNGIDFSGFIVGYMIGSSGSQVLADFGPWGGWPSIFYIYGTITEVFCCLWIYFITDLPHEHSTINDAEKAYIMKSVAPVKIIPIPWFKILTSPPVWGLVCLMFCIEWLLTSFGAGIPEFVNDILMYDLSKEPVLSWIPYFLLLLTTLLSGKLADILVKHDIAITAQRKIMAFVGVLPALLAIVAINFIGCNRQLAVVILLVGFACLGPGFATAMPGALDLSRRHAGLIFGMAFTAGSLANFLIPIKAAYLIQTGATRKNLSDVLYSTVGVAAILLFGYLLLGSGERQKWDSEELESTHEDEPERDSSTVQRQRKETANPIQMQERQKADDNKTRQGNSDTNAKEREPPCRPSKVVVDYAIEMIEEVPEEGTQELQIVESKVAKGVIIAEVPEEGLQELHENVELGVSKQLTTGIDNPALELDEDLAGVECTAYV